MGVTKRRIQRLGGSSLIVTIPKTWAKKMGLGVGDQVVVVDEGDHLKILPPETRYSEKAVSTSIRLVSFAREIPLDKLLDCAYINGFNRLSIQIPVSHINDTDKIVRQVSSYPKASSFSFKHDNQLIVEFGALTETPSRALKNYNSKAQEILEMLHDYISSGKGVNPEEAATRLDEELRKLENLIDMVERGSIKESLVIPSQAELRPPSVAMVRASTRVLRLLAKDLLGYSRTGKKKALEIISLLKNLYSEAIGGMASNSGRRMANALEVSHKLHAIASSMLESRNNLEARLGAYLNTFINLVEMAITGSVCMSLRER
ncbi:MAG: AbrB/MazE/SpoVT family DNA-binding domain-containing protein [Desulfurococcales archaeon]|nr:AbrB/MazE/SpoVT family DNA-binding domain-containing protein [Desulfurococcales archaeon]